MSTPVMLFEAALYPTPLPKTTFGYEILEEKAIPVAWRCGASMILNGAQLLSHYLESQLARESCSHQKDPV
ncbi:hypothetical protein Trisim1_004586 [Trichoderma cf. simile WF8]